jgi:hypothetical protein
MFESIYEILIIISLLLGIVGTVAGWFKSEKAKKIAKSTNYVKDQVEKFVLVAENLQGMTGPEKKKYVMQAVAEKAQSMGYNVKAEEIDKTIENVINITKRVNVKKEEE